MPFVDHRPRLLLAVAAMPGASTRALAAELGLAETTAMYHLRILLAEGSVQSQVSGRERAWFRAACGYCPVLRRALPVLRRPGALAVARALTATPSAAPDLAARAGVPAGAARWAAGGLERAFLVRRTSRGRVALREGADVCLRAATEGRPCSLWGRCPVSAAWRDSLQGVVSTAPR